jgi:p-hydroxybenzoate 3-monooxygenase
MQAISRHVLTAPAPTMPVDARVGIIGAGPAGLVLSHLLDRAGVDSVVLEARDRAYVEGRVRAGVLEHGTVQLLDQLGLADRLHREGLVHDGVNLQFEGRRHRIDLAALTGKSITVYGQQEVVKDLIAARQGAGGETVFGAEAVAILGLTGELGGPPPLVRFRHQGQIDELRCELVAGCDGFHGVARSAIPAGVLRCYERDYPYAWLGILAAAVPSSTELIYAFHEHGFALHSLRNPALTRCYLQVDPAERLDAWSDKRIWQELQVRLAAPGWSLREGAILEKGITPMRSFVAEPMSWGRLFLAGDASHIVPPTGAKGLNLAVADVVVLARAIAEWCRSGDPAGLAGYSGRCLQRVWRVQDFSTTMTTLMHRDRAGGEFGRRLQQARQVYAVRSQAMQASLAENYVGLPLDWPGAGEECSSLIAPAVTPLP